MYESADIVSYLYETYGNGAPFPEAGGDTVCKLRIRLTPMKLIRGVRLVSNSSFQKG